MSDYQELRKLLEQITPGPLTVEIKSFGSSQRIRVVRSETFASDDHFVAETAKQVDAEFIALARNRLPSLLEDAQQLVYVAEEAKRKGTQIRELLAENERLMLLENTFQLEIAMRVEAQDQLSAANAQVERLRDIIIQVKKVFDAIWQRDDVFKEGIPVSLKTIADVLSKELEQALAAGVVARDE